MRVSLDDMDGIRIYIELKTGLPCLEQCCAEYRAFNSAYDMAGMARILCEISLETCVAEQRFVADPKEDRLSGPGLTIFKPVRLRQRGCIEMRNRTTVPARMDNSLMAGFCQARRPL